LTLILGQGGDPAQDGSKKYGRHGPETAERFLTQRLILQMRATVKRLGCSNPLNW